MLAQEMRRRLAEVSHNETLRPHRLIQALSESRVTQPQQMIGKRCATTRGRSAFFRHTVFPLTWIAGLADQKYRVERGVSTLGTSVADSVNWTNEWW
jgi:hypothetical protein